MVLDDVVEFRDEHYEFVEKGVVCVGALELDCFDGRLEGGRFVTSDYDA